MSERFYTVGNGKIESTLDKRKESRIWTVLMTAGLKIDKAYTLKQIESIFAAT